MFEVGAVICVAIRDNVYVNVGSTALLKKSRDPIICCIVFVVYVVVVLDGFGSKVKGLCCGLRGVACLCLWSNVVM